MHPGYKLHRRIKQERQRRQIAHKDRKTRADFPKAPVKVRQGKYRPNSGGRGTRPHPGSRHPPPPARTAPMALPPWAASSRTGTSSGTRSNPCPRLRGSQRKHQCPSPDTRRPGTPPACAPSPLPAPSRLTSAQPDPRTDSAASQPDLRLPHPAPQWPRASELAGSPFRTQSTPGTVITRGGRI